MPQPLLKTHSTVRLGTAWLCLVVLLLLGACEDTVDPILDSDRQLTLFATLDMARDTQYVRVIPIREDLLTDPSSLLEVTFTSTDLATGEILVWRDSLITFANGTTGHVFYTPLRIAPGHTYLIEVQPVGSDLVTSAMTTVPVQPLATVMPENPGLFSQTILWEGVDRKPFFIEHWYRFLASEQEPFRDYVLPYEAVNRAADANPNAWQVQLDFRHDRQVLDTLLTVDEVALAGLGMEITVLDEAFVPPGGVFDPEVLVQPGAFSNVENGFGFIGSVGRFSVEWIMDENFAHDLNYRTIEDIFGKNAPAIRERLRESVKFYARAGHHPGLQ
jgi:hypothetical protein